MAGTHITIPFFIPHLGCPHRCVFCDQKKTAGEGVSIDGSFIARRIESYLGSIKKQVTRIEAAFFGGTFTGLHHGTQKRLLKAVSPYLRSGQINGIRISTRPDCIDTERLGLLKDFGVETIELGAQSFSDRVLSLSKRGHSAGDTIHAAGLIRDRGFKLVIQIMPGLPGDTRVSSIETAKTAAGIQPDGARIYPAVVIEGTEMARLFREGSYTPLGLDDAIELCAEIHAIFTDNDIPVIRTGLHPVSEGQARNILAGPYHPAFGFFVKSFLKRKELERAVVLYSEDDINACRSIVIDLPEKEIEEYIGHRRGNIDHIREMYSLEDIVLRVSPVDKIMITSRAC